MLGTKSAAATIPVKDIRSAKRFYEGTVGLKPEDSRKSDILALVSD
jgi:predicted enzyme related to lactoylglutathione lyase